MFIEIIKYLGPKKLKFTMYPIINYQLPRETGKYDLQWGENLLIQTDPELTQLKLADKKIKTTIIIVFHIIKK